MVAVRPEMHAVARLSQKRFGSRRAQIAEASAAQLGARLELCPQTHPALGMPVQRALPDPAHTVDREVGIRYLLDLVGGCPWLDVDPEGPGKPDGQEADLARMARAERQPGGVVERDAAQRVAAEAKGRGRFTDVGGQDAAPAREADRTAASFPVRRGTGCSVELVC